MAMITARTKLISKSKPQISNAITNNAGKLQQVVVKLDAAQHLFTIQTSSVTFCAQVLDTRNSWLQQFLTASFH